MIPDDAIARMTLDELRQELHWANQELRRVKRELEICQSALVAIVTVVEDALLGMGVPEAEVSPTGDIYLPQHLDTEPTR